MYDVLVKNGRIVTADSVSEGNIAIRDGKIAAVLNAGEEPEAAKVIDAKGNYVFPGAIDTHAHLNDPGYEWREDYEHGTAAAALGGYTTVIDMPLQNEPAMVNAEAFDFKLKKVDPNAYCDYCFWGGLIPDNFKDLKDLDEKGCVAFKSFIGPVSPDYSSLNYGQAYEAMEIIKEFDGRAGFHCEDFSMIKNLEKIEKAKDPNSWQCFLDFLCRSSDGISQCFARGRFGYDFVAQFVWDGCRRCVLGRADFQLCRWCSEFHHHVVHGLADAKRTKKMHCLGAPEIPWKYGYQEMGFDREGRLQERIKTPFFLEWEEPAQ